MLNKERPPREVEKAGKEVQGWLGKNWKAWDTKLPALGKPRGW